MNGANLSKINQNHKELDLEKEFNIFLNSALVTKSASEMHYANRARKMSIADSDNFFTLAAETVVLCLSSGRKRIDKYHAISMHLKKVRGALDPSSQAQTVALGKVEELAESVIDIFDY